MTSQNVAETLTSPTKDYTLNKALEKAGMGRFQWRLVIFLGAISAIDSCQIFMMTFMIPCVQEVWDFDSIWDSVIPASFFVGILFASIIWAKFADIYGRRKVLLIGMVLMATSTSATVFVTNVYQLVICRFLSGLGYIKPTIIILVMEFSPVKARAMSMVSVYYGWTLGGILSILFAWSILPNVNEEIGWRLYVLATSIPAWIVTITTFWLPESARWYSTVGEFKKAETLIRQVFVTNGKEPLQGRMIQENKDVQERGKIVDIFLPKYRIASIILMFSYTANTLCYFGVAFISERLFENYSLYFSEVVITMAELPGASLGFLMNIVCWKWMTIYTRSIPSVSFAIVAILWNNVTSISYIWLINLILIFLARCLCWTSDMVILTYISTYYPTAIRATALGVNLSFARVGMIATMFIAEDLSIPTGLTIMSAVSISACFVSLFLTDITIKDELIDTVDRRSSRALKSAISKRESGKHYVLV